MVLEVACGDEPAGGSAAVELSLGLCTGNKEYARSTDKLKLFNGSTVEYHVPHNILVDEVVLIGMIAVAGSYVPVIDGVALAVVILIGNEVAVIVNNSHVVLIDRKLLSLIEIEYDDLIRLLGDVEYLGSGTLHDRLAVNKDGNAVLIL